MLAEMQESKPKEEQEVSKPEISFQHDQASFNLPGANVEEGEIREDGEYLKAIRKPEEIAIPV